MDSRFGDALGQVVVQTMARFLAASPKLKERRKKFKREAAFEISGIVGVTGPIRGSVAISCPMQFARHLTARMIREPDPAACSEQDICDCIGEVTNIVAGNLLPHLCTDADSSVRLHMSLPSVVVGLHEIVWSSKDMPCESLLFESLVGEFAAEMNFRPSTAGAESAEESATYTVMVVDDSRVTRRMLENALKDAGYGDCEIIQAGDGEEALNILRKRGFDVDVVFCDLSMPKLDGIGFIDALAAEGVLNRLPVIICSGDVREVRGREALDRGARGLIPKPFTVSDVADSLEIALQKPDAAR